MPYSDKYTPRNTTYSNKLSLRNTVFGDKYSFGVVWDELTSTWNEEIRTWAELGPTAYQDIYNPA